MEQTTDTEVGPPGDGASDAPSTGERLARLYGRLRSGGRARHVYALAYDSEKLATGGNAGLQEELRRSPACCRLLDRVWGVASSESADELYRRVIRYFDGDDSILILRLTPEYCAWLPVNAEARTWLRRHM
ncbi:hypothetical protein PC39_05965 [Salinisphaera sp. PC39]|uniref:hypothetical protein n=1 Tax=Salinisphaera sp. PC39 TaxID=1304156 RepID=UPI0033429475